MRVRKKCGRLELELSLAVKQASESNLSFLELAWFSHPHFGLARQVFASSASKAFPLQSLNKDKTKLVPTAKGQLPLHTPFISIAFRANTDLLFRHDDYSRTVFLLRQGQSVSANISPLRTPSILQSFSTLTLSQVIGDLWERYLELIAEGTTEGYASLSAQLPGTSTHRIGSIKRESTPKS